jgi:hypothetical protein
MPVHQYSKFFSLRNFRNGGTGGIELKNAKLSINHSLSNQLESDFYPYKYFLTQKRRAFAVLLL